MVVEVALDSCLSGCWQPLCVCQNLQPISVLGRAAVSQPLSRLPWFVMLG
jgi:hypothetical protein